jgi:hypothetical protein
MKIFKYWAVKQVKTQVDGEEQEITCYGGSNISQEDAARQAMEKIEGIKRKIAGDDSAFESYEMEIREEVVREVSPKAVITRNRYGAEVLNTEDMMIMDIDSPPFSLLDLFRRPRNGKERIVEMVRKLSLKPAYSGLGLRVYETHKGIRVIVLGRTFDAREAETNKMMKAFNCDRLYRVLCRKQDCFRARLTPKPSRMKLKAHRVRFPRTGEEENELRQWLVGYEAACRNFRTCKFVEQIGMGAMNDAVRVHDEIAGTGKELRLA